MAILAEYTLPKGSAGMVLVGSRNDDTTVTLPDIGFDFYYNGVNCRNKIYVNGNSWVGFGVASEHLKINRRDASYNNLYYSNEQERGRNVFRIRWEGNSVYSAWNTNDLVWELILYNDNTMVLIIDKIPNNGTNSFDTKGVETTLSLLPIKSYVLLANGQLGTNYSIYEGSYKQVLIKYLIDDGDNGIKAWMTNSWTKISDGPVTEELIIQYGNSTLVPSRTGLILTNPVLLFWTDDLEVQNKIIKTVAIPTSKIITQNMDYAVATGVKSVVLTASVTGASIIKVACSSDSGMNWYSYYNSAWTAVNISELKTKGMTPSIINGVTETQWQSFIASRQSLRFLYYIEKSALADECSIKSIRVNYK